MSQRIITLSKQLANQIAAGEVVERPVSVVKELLENSIDAGATNIKIVLKNGGIDLVEVRDNGGWISSEDLRKAVEKYSTSKIRSLDDLHKVMTFGFRGEALASISSVSKFTISSRTKEATSWRSLFTLWGEGFQEIEVAHNIGTTVRVEEIFFNTPARLNYLKKARTEYGKVYDFVQKMSLVYSDIHFFLEHDGKSSLHFPEKQGLKARIYEIFWEEFSQNMLELSHEFGGVKISGYITDPKISFRNKSRQVLFVNKRIINSSMIFKAVADAYNRFIAHGSFPWYVLFIDVDPTQLDVNVHPRKMEVRFAGESTIFRRVYHGIKNKLERISLISSSEHVCTNSWNKVPFSKETTYYTGSGTKFKNYSPYKNTKINPAQAAIEFSKSITKKSSSFQEWELTVDLYNTPLGRIIWQAHNSYIIVQSAQGITILDQHALAERVIYERLASHAYTPKQQKLLGGIGLHLTLWEKETLETYLWEFESMGFDFEILSHNTVMLQAIPDFIGKQNIEKVFREILGDISELGSKWLDEVRHKIWAFTACRSAIKFWDSLSIFEMNALLRDASIEYSATCPHGRPVVYNIDLDSLQKKYER